MLTDHKQIDKRITMNNQIEVPPWDASNEITGGLQLVCGRPTLPLSSTLVPQTLSCSVCVEDS